MRSMVFFKQNMLSTSSLDICMLVFVFVGSRPPGYKFIVINIYQSCMEMTVCVNYL